MATLPGRDRTDVLVVDVQNDTVGNAWQADAVVGRIAALVERASAAGAGHLVPTRRPRALSVTWPVAPFDPHSRLTLSDKRESMARRRGSSR